MKLFFNVLLCALISTMSFSQEKKDKKKDTITLKHIKLDEIIIKGNIKTDPVLTIQSIHHAKKIVQPKNVADLFNDINGFSLIKRGNYAIDPSFRASQYEQLNIMFDGGTKAMQACPNRMDPITTHVIPEEIERIEVIKGPYSVRYGASFGGIINLVTHKPKVSDFGFNGSVHSGFENNGESTVSMVKLQHIATRFDITGNVGYRDFGNYKDGDGTKIPSSFKSTDYGVKLGFNTSANQRLQASWRQSFGRDVLHAGLSMDTDIDDSSILSLDYKLSNLNGLLNEVTAKAYYSFVDHVMSNTRRPSFMMIDAVSQIEATTTGGKLEFKLVPSDKFTVYTGLDLFNIARDGGRTRIVKRNMMTGEPLPMPMTFNDKVWQDSYIDDVGIFAESKYQLSEKTILTTGLRYDLVISDIKDPEADFATLYLDLDKRTENNISGTVSVKHIIADDFMVEAAYGRGVRSASMIERYINHFTVGQDAYEYVGNPNLEAEINNQLEVGVKGNETFNNSFINTFYYGISGYYSFYDNYILAVIDPSLTRKFMPNAQPKEVKRFININDAYKTGFEAFAAIDFLNDFNFKTEFSYVYTKNKDLNEHLPLTPPFITRFNVGYEKEKFWANINYTITSEQDKIAASFGEQKTDGYSLMDVRLGVKPIKDLTFGVAVLNVFDKTYHNHMNFSYSNQSGFDNVPINDPGRNFTMFLQYKF